MAKILFFALLVAGLWLWWRRTQKPKGRISAREARTLLGLGPDADADQVRQAHRRLIGRVHPDTGGSAELAGRVNEARDVLLAELNQAPPRAS